MMGLTQQPSRREFLRNVVLLAGTSAMAVSMAAAASTVPPYGSVRLRGPIGARLDAMIERHVKSTDVEYITSPFMEKTERRNWWQTEFWGKYMHAAVPFWTYTQDASLRRSIDIGVERILSSQEPCGYIGNYPDELRCGEGWDVWGMKYTLMGLVEYYEATGRRDLLDAAVATCAQIVRDEINIAGGSASSEAWFHGAQKQHLPYTRLQETCVTTTWMRFAEKLLQITEDPKYADELERTFYNAYLAALRPDGSCFAGYTPLNGTRYYGQHHCYMHTDCCNANGPRGFLAFLRSFFQTHGDDTTVFNPYASSQVSATLPGLNERVAFDMYTPGAYFPVTRTWTIGDIVEVSFDMTTRAHVLNRHVAFTRGCLD